MPDFDNKYLLELLRSHTRIPAVVGFDDADCLRDLTGVLHGYILPMVKAEWQEHYLGADSVTAEFAMVDGQAEYEIPRRAIASSIRTALLIGPTGDTRLPLDMMEVDKLERATRSKGIPQFYAFRANRIVLYPTPFNVSTYTLRLPMLIRPARLVLPEACAVVGEVAQGDGFVTLDLTDAAPSALQALEELDVVRAQEPFENVGLEVSASWASASQVTLTGLPAGTVRAGDYLAAPGASPFPQCPVELQDLLAIRTAVEQLAGSGDGDIAAAKASSLQERRADGRVNVKPRTGDPRHQSNGMRKWRFGNGTNLRLTNRGGMGP